MTLDGGAGDDVMIGGRGNTTYRFGMGSGRDSISEVTDSFGSTDVLALGAGITPDDLVVMVDGANIILAIKGTEDRLTLIGQNGSRAPIEKLFFADGMEWNATTLSAQAVSVAAGEAMVHTAPEGDPFANPLFVENGNGSGSGDNRIRRFIPLIDGQQPAELIIGFVAGDAGGQIDLAIGEGLDGTVILRQNGADTDILFLEAGNVGLIDARHIMRLVGVNAADMTATNLSGAPFEWIEDLTIRGATSGANGQILTGGLGNDTYISGVKDNIIRLSAGFGQDIANAGIYEPQDTIEFDATIAPDDVVVRYDGTGSIRLDVPNTGDSLLLLNIVSGSQNVIKAVRFADGTSWNKDQLLAFAQADNAGDDRFSGTRVNDTLIGGDGNDHLIGDNGNDIIDGGPGNDQLQGNYGSDTYRFSAGFGQDVVADLGYTEQYETDVIAFDATLSSQDAIVWRDGENIVIGFEGSEDRLTLVRQFSIFETYHIQRVEFADGTIWTYDQLVAMAEATNRQGTTQSGSLVSTIIEGTSADEILDASEATQGIELQAAGGNDHLIGSELADVLTGGDGNDHMDGGDGVDTYVFDAGFGQDVISDNYDATWYGLSEGSTIRFGAGIAAEDVRITIITSVGIDGPDNTYVNDIWIDGTDDRISLAHGTNITAIEFADGTIWGVEDFAGIAALSENNGQNPYVGETLWAGPDPIGGGGDPDPGNPWDNPTVGADDVLTGGPAEDFLEGLGGNDLLLGGDGEDFLNGGYGNDTLVGGGQTDNLAGGFGNDTYVINLGDGDDYLYNEGGADTIAFGAGIALTDLSLSYSAFGELFITIAPTGQMLSLYSEEGGEFSWLVFEDETQVSLAELIASAGELPTGLELYAGDDGETLTGGETADSLYGGAGDDALHGNAGMDYLEAYEGNDVIVGGAGNDYLDGADGNDSYLYALGDGSDNLWELVEEGAENTLIFTDLLPEDVSFSVAGYQDIDGFIGQYLIVHIQETGDQIAIRFKQWTTMDGYEGPVQAMVDLDDLPDNQLFSFRFADDSIIDIGTALVEAALIETSTQFGQAATDGGEDPDPQPDNIFNTGALDDRIDGNSAVDRVNGGAGNDVISTFAGKDHLTGGRGNDQLNGGAGADSYYFASGDGQDVIVDDADGNRIIFADGIEVDALIVAWENQEVGGRDLIIRFEGNDDRITVRGGMDYANINSLHFADGTVLTHAQLTAMAVPYEVVSLGLAPSEGVTLTGGDLNDSLTGNTGHDELIGNGGDDTLIGLGGEDVLIGGAGNDRLEGGSDNDTLIGGAGDDLLLGGAGDDAYHIDDRDGQDVITDTAGVDHIVMGADISAGSVRVMRTDGGDLVLLFGKDRLTLSGAAVNTAAQIETVEFADGTIWTHEDLMRLAYEGDERDNDITGSDGNDILSGLSGDDRLSGGSGDDTYVFAFGDGVDVITENGLAGDVDTLIIKGYQPDAVRFSAYGVGGQDLRIWLEGNGDSITIIGGLAGGLNAIEQIVLDDAGVIFSLAQISTMLLSAAPFDGAILRGDEGDNVLTGTALADYLSGGDGADSLNGGAGDDQFVDLGLDTSVDSATGGDGRDLYDIDLAAITANTAEDVITDFAVGVDGDVINLTPANPNPFVTGQVRLVQDGDDTVLLVQPDDGDERAVLRLHNVDATSLVAANFNGLPLVVDQSVTLEGDNSDNSLSGTPYNDSLSGLGGDDVLSGWAGDDRLAGGNGADELDGGIGHDWLSGGAGNDRLYGREGNDILVGGSGDDLLVGGDGGSQLDGDDVLSGGKGYDRMEGGLGNDRYYFNIGDGRDTISDVGGSDAIYFGDGISAETVNVTQQADGSIVLSLSPSDSLRIENAVFNGDAAIEAVHFADGSSWSLADITTRAMQGGSGDDVLRVVAGDNGAFIGALNGGGGNDELLGTVGADSLTGGTGDDILSGGDGDDVYHYARGDGQDRIVDTEGYNILQLGTGLNISDVRVIARGGHLSVLLPDEGRIDLGAMTNDQAGISEIRFADGTIWNRAQIIAAASVATTGDDRLFGTIEADTINGLDGDDLILGHGGDDILSGGQGSDRLEGGSGNDQYHFARGDGHDVIWDSAGIDELIFGPGITAADILVQQGSNRGQISLLVAGGDDRLTIQNFGSTGQIETIRFADGTTWSNADLIARMGSVNDDLILGDGTDNVLDGGFGNDRLEGGLGNDTYVFNAGGGHDVIDDRANSMADVLVINGYASTDARFIALEGGHDLVIRFANSGDSITIANGLLLGSGMETIRFADGDVTLTHSDVTARLEHGAPTDEADLIVGTDEDDILAGGKGNDLLVGNIGNDVYRYARGDGDDIIEDRGGDDLIQLTDYTLADVIAVRRSHPTGFDLIIEFAGTGDRLLVQGALGDRNGMGSSIQIAFADGTTWDRDAMRAAVLAHAQGEGADGIYGFDEAEIYEYSAGDDLLVGNDGDDIYRFGTGAGHDIIRDGGSSDGEINRVEFSNWNRADVTVERLFPTSDAVVFRKNGNTGDSLTVYGALGGGDGSIDSFTFADGAILNESDLLDLLDNSAPLAAKDGYFTVTSGQVLTITSAAILANDFDADGDTLVLVAVDGGANGTASIGTDGSLSFTPNADFTGVLSLSYTISDGRNGFAQSTIEVRVRPVATAIDDNGFTVAEDDVLTIRTERLLSNDIDGDIMLVAQVLDAVGGTAALSSDGNIVFTPTPNYNGQARFTYVANTPEGGRAEAEVFITVTPVNDAPTARNENVGAVLEGGSLILSAASLLSNDSDIDGDAVVLQSVQSNADLILSLNEDGNVVITPRDYFWGSASFDYVIADGSGATATARAFVTVTPVNDAPVANDDLFTLTEAGEPIYEDNPIVIGVDRLLANDIEYDGDPVEVLSISAATGGTAELLENGTILFTPHANFNGDAGFDYRVSDGQGGFDTARATIRYTPVNDRPEGGDDKYDFEKRQWLIGNEDQPLEIPISALLGNDTDVDSATISFAELSPGVNGDVVLTDYGTIIFTPDADYWGEATFGYSIVDSEGAVDGAVVTLWFNNVGDAAPVARPDIIYLAEDVPMLIPASALLANDTDIDRDPLQLVSITPTEYMNGTIEFDANGDILFTPNRNATASTGFTYIVTDNADGVSESYVQIVILPSNDVPTAGDDSGFSTPLGIPLVIRASDVLSNDYDIDDVDTDGDGQRDIDLDNPTRPRPTVVGINAILDSEKLALGIRETVGSFELIQFAGETFLVGRFAPDFTGSVTVEYIIADSEGAEAIGRASATVSDFYDGQLTGTALSDYLEGNGGVDAVSGGPLPDWIVALGGDDVILAGDGDDRIEGGDGDDHINGGLGADAIFGGEGFDTVTFEGSHIGVRADLESRVGQGGTAQGDTYLDVEAFIGSDWGDQLYGNAADNRLAGAAGNDVLDGRVGDDTLLGGLGNDHLTGGAGADILDGGEGIDTANYFSEDGVSTQGVSISLANATASGGDAEGDTLISIENLTGTIYDDQLEGDASNNRLSGERGNDILIGGAGDDVLIGGRGADVMDGGDGIDTADYTLSTQGVIIDMANGLAGSGDAQGDSFVSIEIVQGSYHDDQIYGTDGDNILRGGLGADWLDGRGGYDIADYSRSDTAISINLSTGLGTDGDAEGDVLVSIEQITGSIFNDTFIGGDNGDTFQGGAGNDSLSGGIGSDVYLFGFGGNDDTVNENGQTGDIDLIRLDNAVRTRDVSLIREGDDLFIELENQGGFLDDSIRVVGHFTGEAAGIEGIAFGDGTVWSAAQIADLVRVGRFNARDDIVRFATEDVAELILPSALIANDVVEGVEDITLISVGNAVHGTVSINADGNIVFLGDTNYNGDAFFDYTVQDGFGRQSTARVEVNVGPVNDAPVAVDDPVILAQEDQILRIRIDSLLANDYDVDGEFEFLSIIALRPRQNGDGEDLEPFNRNDYHGAATNATWKIDGDYIELFFRPDHYGYAGFEYILSDAAGATSVGKVDIEVAPVNDAPRIFGQLHYTVRANKPSYFSIASFLGSTFDIENDEIEFVGLATGADGNAANGGVIEWDEERGAFRFLSTQVGWASVDFIVRDARGATATLTKEVHILPENFNPRAKDDSGFRTLQNEVLMIDPAELLLNDSDPDAEDVIQFDSISPFGEFGRVSLTEDGMIRFVPRLDFNGTASFEYTINDGRGGTDTGTVFVTILPRNDGPVLRDDIAVSQEDERLYVSAAEAFGNDYDVQGDVLFFEDAALIGEMAVRYLSPQWSVKATLANNDPLPDGLTFDAQTMTLSGQLPDGLDAVEIAIFLTDPTVGTVKVLRDTITAHQAGDLALGLSYADAVLDGIVVRSAIDLGLESSEIDSEALVVSAATAAGRALPEWLAFDAQALQFGAGLFAADADDGLARVQVKLAGEPVITGEGEYTTLDTGLSVEFVINPAHGVDPAVNVILAAIKSAIEGGTLADLSIEGFAVLRATRESGAPLPEWLSFNAETMRFTGTPPSEYVGGLPLRLEFAADGSTTPAFSLIWELPVDRTFVVPDEESGDFGITFGPEAIDVSALPDFNGSIALYYEANDGKGGLSDGAEIIVLNVRPTVEAPVANVDDVTMLEDSTIVVAVRQLLANDRDDDGDYLQINSFGTVRNGQLAVDLADVTMAAPSELSALGQGIWGAFLTDGGTWPEWLSIDAQTGVISGEIPLGFRSDISITWTLTIGDASHSHTQSVSLDGNEGAVLRYTPQAGFSGVESLIYTVADGTGLTDEGILRFNITPQFEPPFAITDMIAAFEDTPLVLQVADLLANDYDVDGDPISLISVLGGINGTVTMGPDGIVFTPDADFAGKAGFDYVVTDGVHGTSIGHVEIDVASTNRAPDAVSDVFDAVEDTPYVFTIADLLANDSDADGETVQFVRFGIGVVGKPAWYNIDGGWIEELPNGQYRFVAEENFVGEAGFDYIVTDGRGESTGRFTFNIAPVNDGPIANTDGIYFVRQGEALTLSAAELLGNDRDVEGDAFSLTSLFGAENGTVIQDGDTVTFTADTDYFGNAAFRYQVNDVHGAAGVGTVEIIILPTNDLPIPVSDTGIEMIEGSSLILTPDQLLSNDIIAEGDTVTFLGIDSPFATLLEDGSYRITPSADFYGVLQMRYSITNASGFALPGSIYVTVLPVQDAPIAADDVLTMTEDSILSIMPNLLLANDREVDGEALRVDGIIAGEGVTVTMTPGGNIQITADPNYNGPAWFEYRVEDTAGLADIGRVEVTISSVNDAPIIATLPTMRGVEDTAFVASLPNSLFTDADGDALLIDVSGAGATIMPEWLSYDRVAQELRGTPPANFNGTVLLEVKANDGSVATVRNFTLTIDAVNDAPVVLTPLSDVTSTEDMAVDIAIPTGTFGDVDGDTLTLSAQLSSGEPLPSWLSFDGNRFTGMPPLNFNGALAIAVTASDGALSVSQGFTLTIDAANDAPVVLTPLADVSASEDTAISIAIPTGTFGDVDGDSLTLTARMANGDALPGWLSLANGQLTGQPPVNFNGAIDIEVTASDGSLSVSDVFRLTLTPVNDAPVVAIALIDRSVAEDNAIDFTLPAGSFADVDGNTLSLSATLSTGSALPSWLSFDAATARFTGTPPVNFNGSVTVRVTADDGEAMVSDDFTLAITPVNDAPTVLSALPNVSTGEDTPINIALPANAFGDVDGDSLNLTARMANGDALPSWLSFDGNRFTGTPPLNFNGALSIAVTASDGSLSVSQGFTLTIAPVNDTPVAVNDNGYTATAGTALTITAASLMANDSDVDGDALSIVSVGGASNGTVSLNAQGNVVYTPTANFTGAASFTYQLSDGSATSSATVSVTVQAPVVTNPYAGWTQGTSGSNYLQGSLFGTNLIFGGAGDDTIVGGFGDDKLAGGIGDDIIIGIFGYDEAHYLGRKADFVISTTWFGIVTVRDTKPNSYGNEGTDTLVGIDKLVFRDGSISLVAPIVLDLDGDGVELLSIEESGVRFDMDGDGVLDRTSWAGSGDGFLYLDRNMDGQMNGISEMSFIGDKDGARSDLEGLSAWDSNADGKLDASDSAFAEFGVWNDANQNGVVDLGETLSLMRAGIASIDLTGTTPERDFAVGDALVLQEGKATRTDGSIMALADAMMAFEAAEAEAAPIAAQAQLVETMIQSVNAFATGKKDDRQNLGDWKSVSDIHANDALLHLGS